MTPTYPMIVTTLWEFGLISEEAAEKALDEYDKQYEIVRWWWELADIAHKQSVSGWTRFWSLTNVEWKRDWIDAHA